MTHLDMQWTMEVDERQFVAVKELNLTGLKIAMMIDKY